MHVAREQQPTNNVTPKACTLNTAHQLANLRAEAARAKHRGNSKHSSSYQLERSIQQHSHAITALPGNTMNSVLLASLTAASLPVGITIYVKVLAGNHAHFVLATPSTAHTAEHELTISLFRARQGRVCLL
jgi:hypothetical protein